MNLTKIDIQTQSGDKFEISGKNADLLKIANTLDMDPGLVKDQILIVFHPEGIEDLKKKIQDIQP